MKKGKWEGKYRVISTEHISYEEDQCLLSLFRGVPADSYIGGIIPCAYGYIVVVDSLREDIENYTGDPAKLDIDISMWKLIIEWAEASGYSMLRLDRDGDIIEELPKFDW